MMRSPVRVLELRSAVGSGGGPEKTILLGAARADRARYAVTVCYIRDLRDRAFDLDQRAAAMQVDFEPLTERHSFDLGVVPKLHRLIRRLQIDIVHAHDYKTDALAWLVSGVAGAIPMSTVHGWSSFSRKEQFYYWWDKRFLARYPSIIAVSSKIKSQLLETGARPADVQVIHNGIDAEQFRPDPAVRARMRRELGIPDGRVVLGAVGRLSHEKRFELLIEAASRLQNDNVRVVLVGEGDERGRLESCARQLGMADRVTLTGHRSDVREVHQIFDVYVQTSDTEGISNSVLEAMALRTPIVATDVGGTSELIADGVHGVLVPKGDLVRLTAAIQATIGAAEVTAARVDRARARVQHEFSFAARMKKVEAIYDHLVERFPRRASRRIRWQ